MIRAALVFLVFSLLAGQALAAFYDGNALFADCDKGDEYNTLEWRLCSGYITGVAEALPGQVFCLPATASVGQIRDTVKLWLKDHPEKRHLAASSLVVNALKEKFPCP